MPHGSDRRPWHNWLRLALAFRGWLVLYVAALSLASLGLALVLTHFYRTAPFPPETYYFTLQFVPRPQRGLLLLGAGAGLLVLALLGLQRSLLGALLPDAARRDPLAAAAAGLDRRRAETQGPKVVAIGSGSGLATLLRELKELPVQLTAVVSVSDDGGSSGRLRRDLGIPPPGDFRQCLAALADAEPLVRQLFEHRFDAGEGLAGHSFGDLFLAALTQLTGSFERAVEEAGRVLSIRGRILPATLEDCTLCAELSNHATIRGESRIAAAVQAGAPGGIVRVSLDPPDPAADHVALRALLDADLIVLGPGSLYTSILPILLVPDLARALCWSPAHKIYVCNVATQPGETDACEVLSFVRAVLDHVAAPVGGATGALDAGWRPLSHVLVNDNLSPFLPPGWGVTCPELPQGDEEHLAALGVAVFRADVVRVENPTHHDPHKLARAVVECHAAWQRERSDRRPARWLGAGLARAPRAVASHGALSHA